MDSEYIRGHKFKIIDGKPVYCDTGKPTFYRKECGFCHKTETIDGVDPCLGVLPGVMNACCGHGSRRESYIQFENRFRISGFKLPEKGEEIDPKAEALLKEVE